MAKTNVVDKYCSIAKAVKHKALTMLESNVSQKDVSKFTGVSPSTIGRLLDSDQALLRFNSRTLPTNIAIDEFRGPQGSIASLSLIMIPHKSTKFSLIGLRVVLRITLIDSR
uniref:transposase family protein n=1 Tax=Phytohabitans flavus TaxID=1076124 RepID=UPI00366DA022